MTRRPESRRSTPGVQDPSGCLPNVTFFTVMPSSRVNVRFAATEIDGSMSFSVLSLSKTRVPVPVKRTLPLTYRQQ